MNDIFSASVDLTDDCGASVSVPSWSPDRVRLGMGGDLSISISMPRDAARAFGLLLLRAAGESDKALAKESIP